VRENLLLFARQLPAGQIIEQATAAFPKLGQRLSQAAGTLSGGEQQMLALARAHVQQAPVVMLDEVSMGLAPVIVDEIYEFITQLATAGVALLIVEQYVDRILGLADDVYVLNRGRIAFAGESTAVVAADLEREYLGLT
jgi:branched-chain amino acid transport system ATP-binding protein